MCIVNGKLAISRAYKRDKNHQTWMTLKVSTQQELYKL